MTLLFTLLAGLLLRPSFNSCSVYPQEGWKGDETVEFRQAGGAWERPDFFRGSLTGLREDTAYELRILRSGKTIESGSFRTWKSNVPVARTIEIDPASFRAPCVIDAQGSPDGWVRYTVKGGAVLENPSSEPTFIVRGARYVLLDGMTLRGARGAQNVIFIEKSAGVRVLGCDIAGWGREGKPNYTRLTGDKRFGPGNGRYIDAKGRAIDYDGAIRIDKGASEVVVERCYMHDPVSRSNAWYYSHPKGPQAVIVAGPDHSTVLRWNDFVGSDAHRWNDAVEGPGNFNTDGGFNRDADICGNFMIFADDDCIELDGGQREIRCWGNRFEGAFCGVSVQGCMVGPSYVFDNLFSGLGDEYGQCGQTVKTGGGRHGETAHSFVYDNLFWGPGNGIVMRENLALEAWNNSFFGSQKIKALEKSPASKAWDNRFGLTLPEQELDPGYPRRPLPFSLSRARISVGRSREPVVIDITGTLPEGTRIEKPQAFDWFEATLSGHSVTVRFLDEKMHARRDYRGAFLLRTPEGLSRPVSLYATSSYVPPLHAERPGDFALYAPGFSLAPGETREVVLDVPRAGQYYLMVYGKSRKEGSKSYRPQLEVSMDGQTQGGSVQQNYKYPTRTMIAPGGNLESMTYDWQLEAGRHRLQLKGLPIGCDYAYEALVLTDNPESFDPNRE